MAGDEHQMNDSQPHSSEQAAGATQPAATQAAAPESREPANNGASQTEQPAQANATLSTPRFSFIFQYFVPSMSFLPGMVPSVLFGRRRSPPPLAASEQQNPVSESTDMHVDAELPDLIPADVGAAEPTIAGIPPTRAARPAHLSISTASPVAEVADETMNIATPLSAPDPVPGTAPSDPTPPPTAAASAGAPPTTGVPPTPSFFLPNAINMVVSPSGYPIFFHPAVGPFVVISRVSEGQTATTEGQPPARDAQPGQATLSYHLTPLANLPPPMLAQLFPNGVGFLPFMFPNGMPTGTWETDRGRPPTASQEAIRKLPVMRWVTKKLWERNRSCTVCFEDLPCGAVPPPPASDSPIDKVIVRLPCSHLFHLPCVHPWLTQQSNACPACRYELPTGDLEFDRGVKERMSLWKLDANCEGPDDEIVYEMLGEGDGTAGSPKPEEDDGCEMRRVVGRCLRSEAAEISVPAELAQVEAQHGIPVSQDIGGTSRIDAWNGMLRQLTGCGHEFHAECLASLLSVRGYSMPDSADEEVRCPICRKPGKVVIVPGQPPLPPGSPMMDVKDSEIGVVGNVDANEDPSRKRKADENWVSGNDSERRPPQISELDNASFRTIIEDLD